MNTMKVSLIEKLMLIEVFCFFEDVGVFKANPSGQKAIRIFQTYLAPNSTRELNVSNAVRKSIAENMKLQLKDSSKMLVDKNVFDLAEQHVRMVLKEDVFPRFCLSSKWIAYVAQQPKQFMQRYAVLRNIEQVLNSEHAKKYFCLVRLLLYEPRLSAALAQVCIAQKQDQLSQALFDTLLSVGNINAVLHIIDNFLKHDISTAANPVNVFKNSSLLSKLVSRMVHHVGVKFLKSVLFEPICKVYSQTTNSGNIVVECSSLLFQSFSKNACQLPREIRYLCFITARAMQQHKLAKFIPQILGDLIMFRFLCPAILLPNVYGIHSLPPSGISRNILTAVTKLLQKVYNGEQFHDESMDISVCNTFINENRAIFAQFLLKLCDDDSDNTDEGPFVDICSVPACHDMHLKAVNMSHMQFLHQLIYEHGLELSTVLQQEVMNTAHRTFSIVSANSELQSLVMELGPPESNCSVDTAKREYLKKSSKQPSQTMEAITDGIVKMSVQHFEKNINKINFSELQDQQFATVSYGSNNVATIYIQLHLTSVTLLNKEDTLIAYFIKHFIPILSKCKYVVVLDLSWIETSEQYITALFKIMHCISHYMISEYAANCNQLLVLHASLDSRKVVRFIEYFMSEKSQKKLQLCYDYRNSLISELVPFRSTLCMSKIYKIRMQDTSDAKGYSLHLVICYSSLLFFSEKSKIVKKEILTTELEQFKYVSNTTFSVTYKCATTKQLHTLHCTAISTSHMHMIFRDLVFASLVCRVHSVYTLAGSQTSVASAFRILLSMNSAVILRGSTMYKIIPLSTIYYTIFDQHVLRIFFTEACLKDALTFEYTTPEIYNAIQDAMRILRVVVLSNAHTSALQELFGNQKYIVNGELCFNHVYNSLCSISNKIPKPDNMELHVEPCTCKASKGEEANFSPEINPSTQAFLCDNLFVLLYLYMPHTLQTYK